MTDYILDGRYRLTDRIASGGMGEVWRGVDEMLGRPVAVKLLSSQHAGEEQFRARFRAEARYAAALSHNGIARVYDYGENSPLGGPYLVMELVDGEPLSAILEREGRLPADVTLDIISQAARALAVAHQSGIVHRDIKPGNLLITADGVAKITDFGIAKAREAVDQHLTQTGIVMGTAMYVSPEQATGATVTGASDIYSLGIVAYECLVGQPPFVAEQPLAIAIMHKQDPVPPLPDDVPQPVADLVLSMLAKEPADRPESALDVADRADAIRAAISGRRMAGIPSTVADLPQLQSDMPTRTTAVPDFAGRGMHDLGRGGLGGSPTAAGLQNAPTQAASSIFSTERTVGSPLGEPYLDEDYGDPGYGGPRRRGSRFSARRVLASMAGVVLLGVVAVVALMLSSSGHTSNQMTDVNTPAPTRPVVKPVIASKTPTPTPSPTPTVVPTTPPATTPPPVQPTKTVAPTTKAPTKKPTPTPSQTTPTPTPSAAGSPTATAPATPTTTPTAVPTTQTPQFGTHF